MWNGTHVMYNEKQTEMAWKTRQLFGNNVRERERERERRGQLIIKL